MWQKTFIYRIDPYLQLGLLVEEDKFKFWKERHFVTLDERFVRNWNSNAYILYSSHHTKIHLESNQNILWIDPTIQKCDFKCSEKQKQILKTQLNTIAKHYPTRKLIPSATRKRKSDSSYQYYVGSKYAKQVHFLELRNQPNHDVELKPRRIYVHPTSGGRRRTLLLDTGAEQSSLSSELWSSTWEIVKQEKDIDRDHILISASGDELKQVCPPTYVKLKFGNVETVQRFFIVSGLKTNLLGLDWMASNQVSLLANLDQTFSLRIGNNPSLFPTFTQLKTTVTNANQVTLNPGLQQLKCNMDSHEFLHVQVRTDSLAIPQVNPKTYFAKHGVLWLEVNNPLDRPIYLDADSYIGEAETIEGQLIKQNNCVYIVRDQEINMPVPKPSPVYLLDSQASSRRSSIVSLEDSEMEPFFQPMHQDETMLDSSIQDVVPAGIYDERNSKLAMEKLTQDLIEYDQEENDEMYFQDETIEPRGYDFKVDKDNKVTPVGLEEEEFITLLKNNVAKLFPEELRDEMISFFLEECDTLIPKHSLDMGKMVNKHTKEEVFIESFGFDKDAKVKSKPYKLDPNSAKIAESMLEDLCESGVLEAGASEFFSSIFIIPKGSSGYRRE